MLTEVVINSSTFAYDEQNPLAGSSAFQNHSAILRLSSKEHWDEMTIRLHCCQNSKQFLSTSAFVKHFHELYECENGPLGPSFPFLKYTLTHTVVLISFIGAWTSAPSGCNKAFHLRWTSKFYPNIDLMHQRERKRVNILDIPH